VVDDERGGEMLRCRLSLPQAKAAFVLAQREKGEEGADITLDFDELQECIARCGVDKYRAIKEMTAAVAIKAMIRNLLGEMDEVAAITEATYIRAERFDAAAMATALAGQGAEDHALWLSTWKSVNVSEMPGFPLWEKEVHDLMQRNFSAVTSIFRAYAAGSIDGGNTDMDMDEFHDFVIETDLPTKRYPFNAMTAAFSKANEGTDDSVLELNEFVTMLIRISFYRANPDWGLKGTPDDDVPFPACLQRMLDELVLPSARRAEDAAKFRSDTLPLPEVQDVLTKRRAQLLEWWEMKSGGKELIDLKMWLGELSSKFLFNDINVGGFRCRFSEPLAKAGFIECVSRPQAGMMPEEVLEVVARCGVAKYRLVTPMSAGQAVDAFAQNLLGEADEEEAILSATGQS